MTRVVAAVILADAADGSPRVLAGRRVSPPALAGRWEFPGGKVELGEDDTTALRREIREELGVELDLIGPLGGELPMILGDGMWQPFLARIAAGIPQARDHDELRWLAATELHSVRWLTTDVPVLDRVARAMASGHAAAPRGAPLDLPDS